MRESFSAAILAAVSIAAWPCRAASPADPQKAAAAEALFQKANRLMEAGKIGEACELFKESDALDHGPGTRFRLAECREQEGRLASAWALFVDVADELKRGGDKREEQARKRAAALEPRLPRLTVLVSAEVARIPGLEVYRGGTPVQRSLWGEPLPVDPGDQQIEARAPGREPLRASVRVIEGGSVNVRIPDLEPLESGPRAGAPAEARPGAPVGGASAPMPGQRVGALVIGGVGVAGLVVGGVFGLRTFSQWGDADKQCPTRQGCSDEALELESAARTSATISNVGFAVGGAGVLAAGILWLTAPQESPRSGLAGWQIAPVVGPLGALGVARTTF